MCPTDHDSDIWSARGVWGLWLGPSYTQSHFLVHLASHVFLFTTSPLFGSTKNLNHADIFSESKQCCHRYRYYRRSRALHHEGANTSDSPLSNIGNAKEGNQERCSRVFRRSYKRMFVEGNERLSIRKGFKSSNGINFQRAPLPPPCQSVPPSIEPLPAALPAFPAPPCGKFSDAIELELINN